MKQILLLFTLILSASHANAQDYFPPNNSSIWETTDPSELGWCQSKIDSLYDLLEANSSRAFILLKDGKIVLEQYFNGHSANDNWYWASAAKSLTAFMVGIAQQEDYLDIADTTSQYLGEGWTAGTLAQEEKITIKNQLSMTSGLDEGVPESSCTLDTCLQYLAEAGTRWAYHNAPYTLLDQVIEAATGQSLNQYTTQKLKIPIGMNGIYLLQDYNNVFFSTPRSMARYGLLILNEGNWNGNQLMTDTDYFNEMVNTSQELNKSYGYLWWLNGKESYKLPQTQLTFPGSMIPNAPDDVIMALGKNGQFINVVPSENMVWIRMGDAPDQFPVPHLLNDEIWQYIDDLACAPLSVNERNYEVKAFPNPVEHFISIELNADLQIFEYSIYDIMAQVQQSGSSQKQIDCSRLSRGIYFLNIKAGGRSSILKLVKE